MLLLQGIFLTKINEEGPAAKAGLLVGDKLLSVNGTPLVNCEHSDAVSALKKAGDQIEMTILRETFQLSDEHFVDNETASMKEGEKYSTIVERNEKQGGQYGFSIAGGSSASESGQENFYISKVNNQESTGSLSIGDRLLSINGHDTSTISHDQAIDLISHGGKNLELILYREKLTNGNPPPTASMVNIDNTTEVSRAIARIVSSPNPRSDLSRKHASPKVMGPWV